MRATTASSRPSAGLSGEDCAARTIAARGASSACIWRSVARGASRIRWEPSCTNTRVPLIAIGLIGCDAANALISASVLPAARTRLSISAGVGAPSITVVIGCVSAAVFAASSAALAVSSSRGARWRGCGPRARGDESCVCVYVTH